MLRKYILSSTPSAGDGGIREVDFDHNITFSGRYAFTGTLTATTAITFPTSGTLITAAGSETLTNKTLTTPILTSPVITTPVITQGAPTAKTVSATLTAAEIDARIITVNQAAAGASTQTLPLATAMDTYFSGVATGQSVDFWVINTSTVDAEDATIATNTGWTLVGNVEIQAASAMTLNTSAHFRARKTGTAAWTLYRLG